MCYDNCRYWTYDERCTRKGNPCPQQQEDAFEDAAGTFERCVGCKWNYTDDEPSRNLNGYGIVEGGIYHECLLSDVFDCPDFEDVITEELS